VEGPEEEMARYYEKSMQEMNVERIKGMNMPLSTKVVHSMRSTLPNDNSPISAMMI